MKNKFFLIYYEDLTCDTIWSLHNSICLDEGQRLEVKAESVFDVRFKLKNPRTDNFLWKATVIAVGHKDFCDNLRESTWVKVIESNGDMSYLPLIPVVDPDLTL